MNFKSVENINIQYGVYSFNINNIIFRGTEEECVKYIKENNLHGSAEIYNIYPDDPYYLKEDTSNQCTVIYPKIDKKNNCYIISKKEYDEWD